MGFDYQILENSDQYVLSIRLRTSVKELPAQCGRAFTEIGRYLEKIGEEATDAPFAAYYNMDMDNLDLELGFPVSKQIEGSGNIKPGIISGGRKAFCNYKGPYSSMEPVYNGMAVWMKESNFIPTGVVYEYYYNSPIDVPESELLTKIVFPLK